MDAKLDGRSMVICVTQGCKWSGMLKDCIDDDRCPKCGQECEVILPVVVM